MSKEPKRITAKEFREMGLLWYVNWAVLHPLGLALETMQHEDGSETFGGVWDYRDDPEGMLYGDDLHQAGFKRYRAFMDEQGDAILATRRKHLGYRRQTLPNGDECTGEGRCHGTLNWCDICGDVESVCDTPGCDVHDKEI